MFIPRPMTASFREPDFAGICPVDPHSTRHGFEGEDTSEARKTIEDARARTVRTA